MGHNSRNSSWDLLAGFRDFEAGYEHFESRNASEAYLAFAEGDIPQNRFARFYHYLLAASIVTRWTLFIVPVLVLLWIPGILGLTAFPHAAIWGVKLMWWSIWLSVFWGGWWASLATARSLPALARNTVGVVLVGARKYIDWISVLSRYVALFIWTLVSWISFNPLINARQHNATKGGVQAVDIVAKLLFALWIDAAILAAEKFAIQWIAGKFHERSYADRIADQKFAVKVLTLLYRNSRDIPGRTDTLSSKAVMTKDKRMSVDPRKFFKRALKGVKFAATTTTTALGNVASEMTGSSVLQPNSPQAMVQTALQSANKTRLLARRLFYSFQKEGHDYLLVDDIQRFFPARDQADAAFSIFDKDNNGDVTREEMELACLEIHREQLSIEHSMRDLDSAVGRLDNILMSLYVIVAIMLIAIVLDTSLISLVTGAGTLIVALSWLVGDALSEVLSSIIFLFIKHPFDVGDVINLEEDEDTYTVKEIRLLSSILVNGNGALVQAPNVVLNGKMSETFTFDVSYDTTFEQIEDLRARMILFLQGERRDFHPAFDVQVVDIPDQEKMSLKVEIKYKSNWQQGALRAKRRNKWVCMLKTKLAEIPIYGPGGSPDVKPTVSRYTKVPWETVQDEDRKAGEKHPAKERMPTGGWHLSDSNYLSSLIHHCIGFP
ncbi:hypothetical protein PUNSTDRAFT_61874 [Punctularia strigosozonata HHB-11173 SS5]|uniref:uncharacterized protein n=1 Tax=Punctularia strigosozonata (strain HHB-11173) TaxID=741275 RepID=UPI0004416F79|nr:uncharacterized protein PUNSTDRAFT_61874 [Punctularia strigosozonata HHB-11173 SS5]EIN11813.1 hypothetical protein PUNSTDRAFT_61874 [Punctularia strigosozonata HHB-11173 SS5]